MNPTPTFDMIVVGSGGGPDETNLSAYLLKLSLAAWDDGILALEAGSGQGALSRLLRRNPNLFRLAGSNDCKTYSASDIYSFVKSFLITHAHLDHVNSLVISAGSFKGHRKRIYATKQTLQDLETVFSDRIWPNLASWDEGDDEHKLLYSILHTDAKYKRVHPDVSVRTIPLNHGRNELGQYESAAFFIRHDPTRQEFLFFGDVEPDSIAARPQTINVWRAAAPSIPEKLSTIFIECSWPSGRTDDTLFGHLTPEHLADELSALAAEVIKFRCQQLVAARARPARKRQKKNPPSPEELHGALNGVRVFIIHCKDGATEDLLHIREVIVAQVKRLVEGRALGAEILAAEQGMHIRI